jgi:hypothetical protein
MTVERNNQLQRVIIALKNEPPMTMKEIDKKLGIMRKNIRRYCSITGHLAYELTLNPLNKPKSIQLDLFHD